MVDYDILFLWIVLFIKIEKRVLYEKIIINHSERLLADWLNDSVTYGGECQ